MDGEWDKESALSGAEGLVAENDLFRRVIGMQNADLTHAEERIAGLEGELAQAKRHVDALWHTGGENMRELGAENQRLREALERCIAAWDTLDEGFSHTAIEAARAALTPTEEPATCPTCGSRFPGRILNGCRDDWHDPNGDAGGWSGTAVGEEPTDEG